MKQITLLLAGLFFLYIAQAQTSPIMVCNDSGTICNPYYNIDSAITYASGGDYIYVPGGVYVLNSTINKELHIFGAGMDDDSSIVTGHTTINGNVNLGADASNTSIEGLYITGSINGVTSPSTQNLHIAHCNFYNINANITNSLIHACILRTPSYGENNFYHGITNEIRNCYLRDVTQLHSSIVENCTGLQYANNVILCSFKNNIFSTYLYSPYGQAGSNNTIRNNVYNGNCPYYCISSINYENNILLTEANTYAFGSLNVDNLHLLAASAALTAGENGTQVGVYGGLFPMKLGNVPSNPHIYQKTISAATNTNGQLPVQIKVRAENY